MLHCFRFRTPIELVHKGTSRYLGEVLKAPGLFKIFHLECLNIKSCGFKRTFKARTQNLKNITVIEEVGNVVEPIELSRTAGLSGILDSSTVVKDKLSSALQTLTLEYSSMFSGFYSTRMYAQNAQVKSINLDVPNLENISIDCPNEKLIMDNVYAPHLRTLKMKVLSLSSLGSDFQYIYAPKIIKADICLYQQEEGTKTSIREKFTFLKNAHELKLGKGCDQTIIKRDYKSLTTLHISEIYKEGLLKKSVFPKLQTLSVNENLSTSEIIKKIPFTYAPLLENLNLTLPIRDITSADFKCFPNLSSLYLKGFQTKIEGLILPNLKTLDVEFAPTSPLLSFKRCSFESLNSLSLQQKSEKAPKGQVKMTDIHAPNLATLHFENVIVFKIFETLRYPCLKKFTAPITKKLTIYDCEKLEELCIRQSSDIPLKIKIGHLLNLKTFELPDHIPMSVMESNYVKPVIPNMSTGSNPIKRSMDDEILENEIERQKRK